MSEVGWWSQRIDAALCLKGGDGGCCDGSKVSSRFYGVRENGDVGSSAAGGVAEVDRPRVRQGVVVYSFPAVAARWDPAGAAAALAAGLDADRARNDIARACGRSLCPFDGQASVHEYGSSYLWEVSPQEADLANAPEWLLELITEAEAEYAAEQEKNDEENAAAVAARKPSVEDVDPFEHQKRREAEAREAAKPSDGD